MTKSLRALTISSSSITSTALARTAPTSSEENIMQKMHLIALSLLAASLLPGTAIAKLAVFACEPEWAVLAKEIGGDEVEVYSATTAAQDPHQIQARPSLIARARQADLMVCSGAELESGWLPQVQRQSANSRIQSSGPGYFEASSVVQRLEIPTAIDRAEGDIHPGGNPHIQTNPHNIAAVAVALTKRMVALDPGSATLYEQRASDFTARWREAIVRWETATARIKGTPIVVHHRYWSYLVDWLQLNEVATMEAKPGIPPTVAHLEQVLVALARQPARMIIRTPYDDAQPSEWLAERARIPAVVLPGTVGGLPGTEDLFGFFDVTVNELLKAVL
jgi:zinc/manganese transport system substrate-binding protein